MNEDDYNKLEEQVPSKSDEVTRENIPEGQIPSKSDEVTQENTPEGEQKLINAHLSASVLQRPPNELINVNVVRLVVDVFVKIVPVKVSVLTGQKKFATYCMHFWATDLMQLFV